ncbi:hypothetical protein AgCh_036258 [Apium graveolens]
MQGKSSAMVQRFEDVVIKVAAVVREEAHSFSAVMEFTYLSDIEGDVEDWLIRVRICRLWDAVNTKDNSLLSVDMILVNEKENLIHASIRKHLLSIQAPC